MIRRDLKKQLEKLVAESKRINSEIEALLNEDDVDNDKFLSAAELATILGVERGSVSNWIRKGYITDFIQNGKSCNIRIPYKEVEKVVNDRLSKYKNQWNNYLIKK